MGFNDDNSKKSSKPVGNPQIRRRVDGMDVLGDVWERINSIREKFETNIPLINEYHEISKNLENLEETLKKAQDIMKVIEEAQMSLAAADMTPEFAAGKARLDKQDADAGILASTTQLKIDELSAKLGQIQLQISQMN